MDRPVETRRAAAAESNGGASGWLVGLLVVLVGVLVWRMLTGGPGPLHDADAERRPAAPRGDFRPEEQAQIQLYRDAVPSVVHVTSALLAQHRLSRDVFEIPRGAGSGFIWNDQGHIVTNNHVIEGAHSAHVTLQDGSSLPARLVGRDRNNDIAVLKIDAPADTLRPIPVGTSADLQIGQNVFAIGDPFGFSATLTKGLISGLDREFPAGDGRKITGVIQTDAAINPGNSGGPLLDSAGRLIGMNTAIVSPSGAYAGIGFAVPVDTINDSVTQLIRGESVEPPWLGVGMFFDSEVEQAIENGLIDQQGVLVRQVYPGGPAAEAGIQPTRRGPRGGVVPGDLIVAIDGRPVRQTNELRSIIRGRRVGESVTLTLVREGERRDVEVRLQAAPFLEQ
ncbi:MAG TPA: trypsin-like peptidase domain-containing protein [Planctomycetaceae bacterium]|nr:trypsin-like peptidase domain-containing protein [Planctomycetaceae bacterium]